MGPFLRVGANKLSPSWRGTFVCPGWFEREGSGGIGGFFFAGRTLFGFALCGHELEHECRGRPRVGPLLGLYSAVEFIWALHHSGLSAAKLELSSAWVASFCSD